MSENNKLDVCYEVIDLASNYDDEEILSIITDNVPVLKLAIKLKNSISDTILKRKIEKFKKYANTSSTSQSFEKFKSKVRDNEEYRKKISEYMLLKINKFDTDYKLKIFSSACVDFFYGNISQNTLTEISEIIDNITLNDILVIKYLYCFKHKFMTIQKIVDKISGKGNDFKIYSYILKLINLGLILEDPRNTHASLSNRLQKKVKLSSLGGIFYKYL